MSLFADPVADTPPCWRQPHHPLSVPDALLPTHDPAVRRQWCEDAEAERDQTVRDWLMEDRADNGQVLRRWEFTVTPTAAFWWFRTTTVPAGHRLVLKESK